MSAVLNHPVESQALAATLDLAYGGRVLTVHGVAPLSDADNAFLVYVSKGHPQNIPDGATVVSVRQPINSDRTANTRVGWIQSANPRLDFVRALRYLADNVGFVEQERVMAGRDCKVGHTSVVGAEGFGFERDRDGTPLRFPQLGGVVLGDRVEVGHLSTVCRGTLGNTVVGDDTKIDDHVHVAHNVRIGKRVIIAAGVTICGSVVIEDDAYVAPGAVVRDHVTVGAKALVGLGAVVVTDVAPGMTYVGNPAKPIESRRV
jgi:UDP-3-O-[3-hydroxymyristoyl] glucosamine N-acyltransferase